MMADVRDAELVKEAVDRIKPILAGHSADIQGTVLADLLAIWLAGWRPNIREEALKVHLKNVWQLVQMNDKILYGGRGHPGLNA